MTERLRPLLNQVLRQLDASDLLAELTERWDHILTPERLHALRSLVEDTIWKAIPSGAWCEALRGAKVTLHHFIGGGMTLHYKDRVLPVTAYGSYPVSDAAED